MSNSLFDPKIEELVTAIRQETDLKARERGLTDLCERLCEPLRVYLCASSFRNSLTAEDQEDVIWKSLGKITTFIGTYDHHRAKFSTWCIDILKKTAIDWIRQNKRHDHEDLDSLHRTHQDARQDISDIEIRRIIDEFLVEQKPYYRQVYDMRMEGYTPAEIGEKVGKTPKQVQDVITRIQNLLRKKGLGN